MNIFKINAFIGLFLLLLGCSANTGLPGTPGMPTQPPVEMDKDSTLIGPDGPIPLSGYDVVGYTRRFDSGDYKNTVGTFYIMLELEPLKKSVFTQLT